MIIEERLRRHRRRKRMLYGTLVAVVLMAAIATILFFNTYLTTVSVTGNTYLSRDAVVEMLFSTKMEQRTFFARWRDMTGRQKKIPMVQSYRLEFNGLHEVTVNITENEIIGGIPYVDTYLYFDSQGYILCSRTEPVEGIPVINGLVFEQPMLYRQAVTEQQELFDAVVRTAQLLSVYGISADTLTCGEDASLTLVMGKIRVELGNTENIEGKLNELKSMESGLSGLAGTLHLEDYSESGSAGGYTFIPD